MIIAIPCTADGSLAPSFGKAPNMAVATTDDNTITDWQVYPVQWDVQHDVGEHGQHHARVVRFLVDHSVRHVVIGHMGPPMVNTITKMGIGIIPAPSTNAKEAVQLALNSLLAADQS